MQFNQYQFVGRLVNDPEYKDVGTGLVKFSVAVNKSYKKNEEWHNKTIFHNDVDLWGKYAKDTASRFNKGQEVFVVGELDEDQWEETDGQKRKEWVIKVSKIIACGNNGSTPKDSNVATPKDSLEHMETKRLNDESAF